MDPDAFDKLSLDERYPLFTKSLEKSVPSRSPLPLVFGTDPVPKPVRKPKWTRKQKAEAKEKREAKEKQTRVEKGTSKSSLSEIRDDNEEGGVPLPLAEPRIQTLSKAGGFPGEATGGELPTARTTTKQKNTTSLAKSSQMDLPQPDRIGYLDATPTFESAPLGLTATTACATKRNYSPYQPVRLVQDFRAWPLWRVDKLHRFASTVSARRPAKVPVDVALPKTGRWIGSPPRATGRPVPEPSSRSGKSIKLPFNKIVSHSSLTRAVGPQPTSAYMTQSSKAPEITDSPQKLLLVLDLNGTLLERKRHTNTIYPRPRLDRFINYCLARHFVLIWSSAKPQNVAVVCSRIFQPEQQERLVAVWARDTMELSAEDYNEKVQVYKRLDRIWDSQLIQSRHPQFGDGGRWTQANTILIDDSALKAQKQPYNHVEIPEYAKALGGDAEGSEVLGQVVAYLEEARKWQDISCYVRKEKFSLDAGYRWDWDKDQRITPDSRVDL